MIDFSCKHDIWLEDEDGSLQRMDQPFFRAWPIAPGTWQILSDGDFSYMIEGEDEALLIDSGYGAGNIRTFAQDLTDKPLSRICNTHDHFDHTANNSYFDLAYMSRETRELATRPFPSFSGIDFPRDYPVQEVTDGDVIPLRGATSGCSSSRITRWAAWRSSMKERASSSPATSSWRTARRCTAASRTGLRCSKSSCPIATGLTTCVPAPGR